MFAYSTVSDSFSSFCS